MVHRHCSLPRWCVLSYLNSALYSPGHSYCSSSVTVKDAPSLSISLFFSPSSFPSPPPFLSPLLSLALALSFSSPNTRGNLCQTRTHASWTWGSRRHPHGSRHLPQQRRKVWCKEPKIQDIYLRLLVKLYRFLARRTNSIFSQVVLKMLFMSCTNQLPLSLSLTIWKVKFPNQEGKNTVVVGTTTNNVCVQEVPELKVGVSALYRSSRPWARSSPLISGPWVSPRAVKLSCSLVLPRAEQCTGIS